jgi:hydroxymethylpyrimidine pyrophosphatase-like HAD family hydrolase
MPSPALGLLLDVDGPIASPDTRTIAIDSIARDLTALANAGNPVVFNTGRSDAFIRDVVLPALRAHGLAADAPVHAVCEKSASWFSVEGGKAGGIELDESVRLPSEYGDRIRTIVAEQFAHAMFFDETKRTMVSVEQRVDVSTEFYETARQEFEPRAARALEEAGLAEDFHVDRQHFSTDIEHRSLGKDRGAARAIELVRRTGEVPHTWRTAGDSHGDFAMAEWLHSAGYAVEHLDVRPTEDAPRPQYRVLRHAELGLDGAAAAFLTDWRREFVG